MIWISPVAGQDSCTSVPNAVLESAFWKKNQGALVALILLYKNAGNFFPSNKALGESLGYCYETWRRYASTWERSGFVRRKDGFVQLFPFND